MQVYEWLERLIGLLAGAVIYPTTSNGMRRLRLDDPVDAVPVHAAAGFFGVLVTGVCMPDCAAPWRLKWRLKTLTSRLRLM